MRLTCRDRFAAAAEGMAAALLSVDDVFRYPDDLKLRSCLTLFAHAAGPGSIFERLIGRYFGGTRDFMSAMSLQRPAMIEVAREA